MLVPPKTKTCKNLLKSHKNPQNDLFLGVTFFAVDTKQRLCVQIGYNIHSVYFLKCPIQKINQIEMGYEPKHNTGYNEGHTLT
jgi:hypothetical protein